jgi:predicted AAA+ superfamily ATPase
VDNQKRKLVKMYIKRTLEKDIKEGASYFPVVAILGPRQSGKTTLAQTLFSDHVYVSLEEKDQRTAALADPRSFLESNRSLSKVGIIIDEFQYAPDLLSYIQTIVDREKIMGYFVLTGSQNFLMNQSITQSLAGRVSLHTLLPLSIAELKAHNLLTDKVEHLMYQGCYPAIYTKKVPARTLYSQYIKTYLERDVRLLAQVGDLATFKTFLILCAERVGQLVNFTEIGKECRISDQTVKRWLTILEASYIIFLLHPYEKTLSKRLIKRPKLYFYDPGLVCHLLKIKEINLTTHQKRGGIFETLIISEMAKVFYNFGDEPSLYFWQDRHDHEIDCIIAYGNIVKAIEIKSGRTINSDFFTGLNYWKELDKKNESHTYIVYGDTTKRISGYRNVISWQETDTLIDFLEE